MYKLVKPGRVAALLIIFLLVLAVFLVELYKLQIIEGEQYYNRSNELIKETKTVTAARGNILDRYGRILVSNKEAYNIKIDITKLFASEDPNSVILDLVEMVRGYGDDYTDDLPISMEPPFEYDPNMTEIQRTMLKAYFKDKGDALPADPTAVELMAYMRTRYEIDNSYSAEEMRLIAGVRYSINVRYAINTADYVFVQDASMGLISSIMENKLTGIEVSRAYVRHYNTEYAAHLLGYVGLMTQEEYEKYNLLEYANDAYVGKDGIEYAFETELHGKDGEVEETRNVSGTILSTVYTKDPQPGNHIYLTIDSVLQEQTERILANGIEYMRRNRATERAEGIARGDYNPDLKDEITGGAAVVVNVKTGEPLAIASYPTYDVSTIIEKYSELLAEPNAPLFNRALLGAYAPGSAFKPCTAIASLTEGVKASTPGTLPKATRRNAGSGSRATPTRRRTSPPPFETPATTSSTPAATTWESTCWESMPTSWDWDLPRALSWWRHWAICPTEKTTPTIPVPSGVSVTRCRRPSVSQTVSSPHCS